MTVNLVKAQNRRLMISSILWEALPTDDTNKTMEAANKVVKGINPWSEYEYARVMNETARLAVRYRELLIHSESCDEFDGILTSELTRHYRQRRQDVVRIYRRMMAL